MPRTSRFQPAAADPFSQQPTSFIGRRREMEELQALLAEPASACRLLTLVGPGGIGKTRLALAFAARQIDNYDDGVHFVPLQSIENVDHLIAAIVDAIGFSLRSRDDPRAQLLTHLRQRRMLLLLDNFEQLLPAGGAELLAAILNHAQDVTLLVTSREILNLQQEWLYPVRGLSVPADQQGDADEYEAVQLFAERARRVRPGFALDEARQHVYEICRLVDGMPLAIELAASWLKTLDCVAIAAEIRRSIDFLATNTRNVPQRHRSIQAVFEHSWQRLAAAERAAFRKLSVFRGGFRREAAAAVIVAPDAEPDAPAPLLLLSALVDRCMLRRQDDRYQIHELLRQYGEEKLSADPAEAAAARTRHAAYYTGFLNDRLAEINGRHQRRAAAEIDADRENVRAAWQWVVTHADLDAIHRAASTFFYFCQLKCDYLGGADALAEAAAAVENQPSSPLRDRTLARLLNHEGWLRIRVGEFDRARKLLQRSRALYAAMQAPPPPYMGTDPATPLGIVAIIQGNHDRAVALCEEARRAAETREDRHNLAFAHYGLAAARLARGEYHAAYDHAQQACTLARAVDNRWFLAYPLNEWGKVARALGNDAEARRHFSASYKIKEAFHDPEGMAVALSHLGQIALRQQDYQEARRSFRQSSNIYQDINDRGGLATALNGLGRAACALDEPLTARQRFREALQLAAAIQFLPLIFSILVDVTPLLQRRKASALGARLLTVVERHPAGDHATKRKARRELASLQAQMAADVFSGAVREGHSWDLETAVAALQSELAASSPVSEPQPVPEAALAEPLTPREREVLQLLAAGRTNSEIAEALTISVGTVKWYASQIYGKLDVANRTEAAARARDLHLLD